MKGWCRLITINGIEISVKYFPNRELLIDDEQIKSLVYVGKLIHVTWKFEDCGELTTLILIKSMLDETTNKKTKLSMPYLPFSRMDRQIKNQLFTLKHFGKIINELSFDSVEVFDLHSSESFKYIDNLKESNPSNKIKWIVSEEKVDYVFLPDKGAFNRYTPLINNTTFWGEKVRNESTGRIEKYQIPNSPTLKGCTVLMVDDICSKGYTFLYALRELKRLGVERVLIYVSHCEKSILDGELLESDVEIIYTTTSIMFTSPHKKIKLI